MGTVTPTPAKRGGRGQGKKVQEPFVKEEVIGKGVGQAKKNLLLNTLVVLLPTQGKIHLVKVEVVWLTQCQS